MRLRDFELDVLVRIPGQEPIEIGKLDIPVEVGTITYTGHGVYFKELVIDTEELRSRIVGMARELADTLGETLPEQDHPDQ